MYNISSRDDESSFMIKTLDLIVESYYILYEIKLVISMQYFEKGSYICLEVRLKKKIVQILWQTTFLSVKSMSIFY